MSKTKKIFDDLMNLTSVNDAFMWKDFESTAGGIFRIFSYRLASYSDFLAPSALECRGTMFQVSETGEFIGMASRTPMKFFNAYENPFTMYDKSTLSSEIAVVMDKLDGSIISTFMDVDYEVRTKSHASLNSDHAKNSTAMLHNDRDLYNEVHYAESMGYTVNMEYTSPEYRIVLPYQEDNLTVLNLRHRMTGELLIGHRLKGFSPLLYSRSVFAKYGEIDPTFPMKETLYDSIEATRSMQDIEGFVLILKDGRMCKIKTDWYCALHFTKDSINVDSRLYEAIITGASDDLKQMFSTDLYSIKKIEKMEQLVFSCYNKLVHDSESFYEANKHLDRKEYALKVQSDVPNELGKPGIAFSLYNSKPVDYKAMMLKYMKDVLVNFEV
ncbi:RNA ligase and tail fiber protein attachment catalyst [Cronobacter phage vB_CsaM_GAP32]|uniref:RNA ligase 1 and tail fiber attachment catalyst n=1 Tax=Cronobacter phage vB_CsaM_GAP32 TaxID=1141136 RepID=K4F6H2_9CAUD|nr:RNA ligase and tail fiber protein attachment catalyst [Cronobacter phage vB_CsaM_GAP32]AFC21528.1 RNA ligase 1 and tail fiber attachment catalyst [Cronobacter phage vB_CsaM_GAP32]